MEKEEKEKGHSHGYRKMWCEQEKQTEWETKKNPRSLSHNIGQRRQKPWGGPTS